MFRTRLRVSVVVALLAAVAAPMTPAQAEHGPQGLLCGFVSVTDPGTEGGDVQTGEIDGGPILVTGDGTITCALQVGQELSSATDDASATGGGNTAAYLTATVVSYVSPAGVPVYLCTTVTDATGTYYWDELTGDWVSSASAAHCSLSTSMTDDSGRGGTVNRPEVKPGGGGGVPRNPVYPRGMVRIYREVGGGVHTYANPASFSPSYSQWNCSQPTLTSYQCTPPRPANSAQYNVCGTVVVVVHNNTAGDVTGHSACAVGAFAQATTTPLNQHESASASAVGTFPWTCTVNEGLLATAGPWVVDCWVG